MTISLKNLHLSGRNKIIAYALYLAAVTVICAYWLFPGDAVREFVERGVENINPRLSIVIGGVAPSFPPGVKFKKVVLSYSKDALADPDYIRVTPGLFSLLGHSPSFLFKSGVFGGTVNGACRLMENRVAHADIRLSGLKLERINLPGIFSEPKISGLMDGEIKADIDDRNNLKADSDIVLSSITVTLANQIPGIPTIDFDTVKADLSISSRRIEIKACTLKGQDLEGEFTGNILVRQPFQTSMLNLSGFLNPQAAFIKKVSETLPVDILMKNAKGTKGIPVRLRGTVQEPRYSLR